MSQPTTTTVVESPEPKPRIVIEEEQIVEESIDAPIEVKLEPKPVAPKKPNFGSKPSFGLKKPTFGLGAKKPSIQTIAPIPVVKMESPKPVSVR